MSTIALTEEMNTAVVAEGMTKYEKISIVLAIAALVISVLVPLVQWIYREKRKAVLKYYPTGHAFAYCNLSGSYIRIDGVFEALKRAISLKKVSISIVRKKDEKKLNLEWFKFYLEIPVKEGRRSAPTVRLVRFYRCEAPPSIVKSLDACLYSVLLGLVNGLLKK